MKVKARYIFTEQFTHLEMIIHLPCLSTSVCSCIKVNVWKTDIIKWTWGGSAIPIRNISVYHYFLLLLVLHIHHEIRNTAVFNVSVCLYCLYETRQRCMYCHMLEYDFFITLSRPYVTCNFPYIVRWRRKYHILCINICEYE